MTHKGWHFQLPPMFRRRCQVPSPAFCSVLFVHSGACPPWHYFSGETRRCGQQYLLNSELGRQRLGGWTLDSHWTHHASPLPPLTLHPLLSGAGVLPLLLGSQVRPQDWLIVCRSKWAAECCSRVHLWSCHWGCQVLQKILSLDSCVKR